MKEHKATNVIILTAVVILALVVLRGCATVEETNVTKEIPVDRRAC